MLQIEVRNDMNAQAYLGSEEAALAILGIPWGPATVERPLLPWLPGSLRPRRWALYVSVVGLAGVTAMTSVVVACVAPWRAATCSRGLLRSPRC
ncbi:MAG: hypothetical protein FJ029_06540 [Actinobacteria bacterium]|nr:hypothetical protein [Actinomycetota bacterium]